SPIGETLFAVTYSINKAYLAKRVCFCRAKTNSLCSTKTDSLCSPVKKDCPVTPGNDRLLTKDGDFQGNSLERCWKKEGFKGRKEPAYE
ncbi:MAG: hypothetical protein IKZ86_12040, partial [Spirochaetaceae bacterium]|nr:hypothetical protein [Spirochaetaceae bacterium]